MVVVAMGVVELVVAEAMVTVKVDDTGNLSVMWLGLYFLNGDEEFCNKNIVTVP